MHEPDLERPTSALHLVAGTAALFGGTLLALTAVIHSSEPVGCIGPEECAIRPMREMSTLVAILGTASLILIVVGLATLAALSYRAGGNRVLARVGSITLTVGVAWLFVGVLVQAVFFNGDLPWMPLFVGPGVIGVLAGVALIAMSVFSSGLLPTWLSILLTASAVVALACNEQSDAVLFIVPLALALAATGRYLCVTFLRRPHLQRLGAGSLAG
jgi:hypothetical protein